MAATFDFRARDAAGKEHRGVRVGLSSAAVARDLRLKGWVPIDVAARALARAAAPPGAASPASPAPAAPAAPAASSVRIRRGSGERVQEAFGIVLRELSALLRAGVPLMRALQLAADSSADPHVRGSLQRISRDLDNGHNLAAAAEHEQQASGLIRPYDIAMLQVGEQTGRLPEAFADLHRQREFARSTGTQVKAALRYPAFVLLTCFIAIVVVNMWVLPSFARVFAQSHAPLPTLTLLLMGASRLLVAWWPAALALLMLAVFGWRRWIGSAPGRLWWDRNKLRLPVVGRVLQGIVLARLSGALASAISAGLTITEALQVSARTLDNRWFETRLSQMVSDLARGASITAASRQMGVLPPTMLQLFAIGEESGSLEVLMREISVHYQTEVDYAVKSLSATLEPILIWFLGIGVLILALGVFMPMWDLGRAAIR